MEFGAASVQIVGDDSMIIAGGILPAYYTGQEGELRASCMIIKQESHLICLVVCDVIMIKKIYIDQMCDRIKQSVGIERKNILITATHTHHAPSTIEVHGYKPDSRFMVRLQDAVVEAVTEAFSHVVKVLAYMINLQVDSIGQNSRLLLDDKQILWVPQNEEMRKYPTTGPYDPDMPVVVFKDSATDCLKGILFNHSCHNIGNIENKRSPGFYGLAAQELEKEMHCPVIFTPGASGSTHDFSKDPANLLLNIKHAIQKAIPLAIRQESTQVATLLEEFDYHIRYFDEQKEEQAVTQYCTSQDISDCGSAEDVIGVFRSMRKVLSVKKGDKKSSCIQAVRIGDIAFLALPGEVFTSLGLAIKEQSPFTYTYIIELSNDSIGYIPDEQAFDLGGYQVWTGFHSVIEKGLGETLVNKSVMLLHTLFESV